MIRKTMKMLVVALIAAFALSSSAEAAAPKKTRHRAKHSSRVASGAATTGKKPAAKKKAAREKRDAQREGRREGAGREKSAGETPSADQAALTRLTAARRPLLLGETKANVRFWPGAGMSSFPLLFDLGSTRPTTRDIANTVKAGGTARVDRGGPAGRPGAYQEVTCRSALNP
jgi:regulator of protease activity HflC (stomatin/prohibitin superfamily)